MRYVVGLTGGIGAGKTEVAALFAALGADVLDADTVAHAISARGQPGHAALVEAFGSECLQADGTIDRDWLRERAFADPVFRDRLERALHPIIIATIRETIATWRGVYGILVVPLLLERGGLLPSVRRVLVVDCPEDLQVRRVVARSGLLPSAVRAIMATQLARSERLARADDVIDNGGTPEQLKPQVERLDHCYRELAQAPASQARAG